MALIDQRHRPFRDLRISVTDRCNFRCAYCMPADVFGEAYRFLPKPQLLTFEEIARLARVFAGLGAQKIRLTGGEPLIRKELETLIAMLGAIPGIDDIALTTNGYFLPQKAQVLREAGLQRVTVSLDSLDGEVFRLLNGDRADVEQVLAGIEAARRVGFAPIKINAVIKRGVNDRSVVGLARFCRDRGYIARFIEYMDVGTRNGWRLDDVVPAREIVETIDAALPLEPVAPNYPGEVATRYRYRDGGGEIGVIASVTQPFCGGCTRLRLSPEGQMFTCLFGTRGVDLRGPLRDGVSDEALAAIARGVWQRRDDRYSEIRTSHTAPRDPKVEMYHIGG
ncbi:MAG: GTP 3',8-cyclase MoaA [Chloroflexi bacterium]|nr:GTP 3',8-cyclase MoaA [Chloroflexota bacterium]